MDLKYFLSSNGIIQIVIGLVGLLAFFMVPSILKLDGSFSYPVTLITVMFFFLLFEWLNKTITEKNKSSLKDRLKCGITYSVILSVLFTLLFFIIRIISVVINGKIDLLFQGSVSILITLFMGVLFLSIIPLLFSALTFNPSYKTEKKIDKKFIFTVAGIFVAVWVLIYLIEILSQIDIADYWSYGFPLAYYVVTGPCYQGACITNNPMNLIIDVAFWMIVSIGLARLLQKFKK